MQTDLLTLTFGSSAEAERQKEIADEGDEVSVSESESSDGEEDNASSLFHKHAASVNVPLLPGEEENDKVTDAVSETVCFYLENGGTGMGSSCCRKWELAWCDDTSVAHFVAPCSTAVGSIFARRHPANCLPVSHPGHSRQYRLSPFLPAHLPPVHPHQGQSRHDLQQVRSVRVDHGEFASR